MPEPTDPNPTGAPVERASLAIDGGTFANEDPTTDATLDDVATAIS